MAILGKETLDDVDANDENNENGDQEGTLNPDPSQAIAPATDAENKPEGEGEDGSKEDEAPKPPRTVCFIVKIFKILL